MNRSLLVITVLLSVCGAAGSAEPDSVAELEAKLRATPDALAVRAALAEAYLKACELDKSLAAWRDVLRREPNHARAQYVVGRLTAQQVDLDTHLDILRRLLGRGVREGVPALLDAAAQRATTDTQKAWILYLRALHEGATRAVVPPGPEVEWALVLESPIVPVGPSSRPHPRPKAPPKLRQTVAKPNPAAVGYFQAAAKLYPQTVWGARSALALAELEELQGRNDEARRLLRGVIDNAALQDEAVKELAHLALAELSAQSLAGREKAAVLREALGRMTTPESKRKALSVLSAGVRAERGRWTSEAVELQGQILQTQPPVEEAWASLKMLLAAARASEDRATLEAIIKLTAAVKFKDAVLGRERAFLLIEAGLARAVVEDDPRAMAGFLDGVSKAIALLEPRVAEFADRQRVQEARSRRLLIEAQKTLALAGAEEALPAILRAKEHFLALMDTDPHGAMGRLAGTARLLEHAGEWATAIAVYREVARRWPHLPQGRDALLRVARIHERQLDAPVTALDTYVEYAARYPAELPYRQLGVGERLKRVGYASVQDFQKRNHIKVDGLFGPASRGKLEEIEEGFDQIRASRADEPDVLRGLFVHPNVYAIARRLELAGRHHEAIRAYRVFLNLYPTKRHADDALLAVARLFRANLLFVEALGAYEQLREDYPKGDMTSEAYVESAGCLENLGRWSDAREMYELYLRKFPKFHHVALCKARLAMLEEIEQYASFVADNPKSPKAAEAQYQIGAILYKKSGNHTKAAVEFVKVADRHPAHARAPEALFTAATAQLRAENFPAARALFERLVKAYPASRLADDGQYWSAHTWEYAARALGKLDAARIILNRRGLSARATLAGDLALRKQYHPQAEPGEQMPQDVWGGDALGVLASGSKRDRVNADLYRAIREYRKVVDQFKMGDMAGAALLRVGEIYTKYLKDPQRGVGAYQELLARYPASKEAAGAMFEVGAYYQENKKYAEAVKAYQQFIFNFPRENKVQDAMLAIARCHMARKAWNEALDAFQSYLSKFPTGARAAQAKAQVEWIRMYHF